MPRRLSTENGKEGGCCSRPRSRCSSSRNRSRKSPDKRNDVIDDEVSNADHEMPNQCKNKSRLSVKQKRSKRRRNRSNEDKSSLNRQTTKKMKADDNPLDEEGGKRDNSRKKSVQMRVEENASNKNRTESTESEEDSNLIIKKKRKRKKKKKRKSKKEDVKCDAPFETNSGNISKGDLAKEGACCVAHVENEKVDVWKGEEIDFSRSFCLNISDKCIVCAHGNGSWTRTSLAETNEPNSQQTTSTSSLISDSKTGPSIVRSSFSGKSDLSTSQSSSSVGKSLPLPLNEVKEKPEPNALDLPGFHYDASKKRYFRILPGSINCMSSVVTRETIAFDRNETIRRNQLRRFLDKTSNLCREKSDSTVRRGGATPNIPSVVERTRLGLVSPATASRQIRQSCFARLRPHVRGGTASNAPFTVTGLNVEKMAINAEQDKLVVLYGVDRVHGNVVELCSIENFRYEPLPDGRGTDTTNISLDVRPIDFISEPLQHIIDICWAAPPSSSDTRFDRILYSTTSVIPSMGGSFSLNRFTRSRGDAVREVHSLLSTATRCCRWKDGIIGVGTESCVVMYDVNFHKPWKLNTLKSEALSLAFAHTTSKILFCGLKSGNIMAYDGRNSRKKPVAFLENASGICNVFVTKDEIHLVSADYSGKIANWDLRKGEILLEYKGHVNDYIATSVNIDEGEEFICAVGTDCYTRLWDLRNGDLLTSLPPPLPASRKSMPAVCFSEWYGGSRRNNYPGIILAMADELSFYSL